MLTLTLTNVDVPALDRHLTFLAEESRGLREKYGNKYWAEAKAGQLDQIHEVLRQVRQAAQMTGLNNQRLEN